MRKLLTAIFLPTIAGLLVAAGCGGSDQSVSGDFSGGDASIDAFGGGFPTGTAPTSTGTTPTPTSTGTTPTPTSTSTSDPPAGSCDPQFCPETGFGDPCCVSPNGPCGSDQGMGCVSMTPGSGDGG